MQKILFPLLLLPSILLCQPKITLSPAFETKGNALTFGLLKSGASENLLLVYRTHKWGNRMIGQDYVYFWAADVFSPDLKRLTDNKPEKLDFPDGEDVATGSVCDFGGPNLVVQQQKRKEKKMVVYRCPIGPDGRISPPKRVGDYDAWKSYDGLQKFSLISPDSSLLLLALKPPEKNRDEPISYIIFNREWKQVREGKLKMPGIDAELLSGDFLLASDTSIWMPAWVREKGREELVRQEIWVWRNPATPPQRIDVALSGERVITGMTLTQSTNGLIYAGGTFAASTKNALKGLFKPAVPPLDHHPEQGAYCIKINDVGTIVAKESTLFRDSTFQFWKVSPSDVQKGDGINVIGPRRIYLQPDGSAWLTLEEYYDERGSIPGTVPGTTGALAHSGGPRGGPAIAVRFDADGKPQQELLIPKRAWSIHGSGMGYLLLTHQGQLAFLYNDHEDNLKRTAKVAGDLKVCKIADDSGMATGQQEACTALYFVDGKGQGKAQKLFGFKDTRYWFDPDTWFQVSPTRYIIGCNGRSGQFGLLRVDWPE